MNKKFWLVWREAGLSCVKHASKEEALKEACRLAAKERSMDFFVMEAVCIAYDKNRSAHVEYGDIKCPKN